MRRVRALLCALGTGVALVTSTIVVAADVSAATTAEVVRWKDGDTLVTTRGTIRLIGVDTPESGHCGYGRATRHANRIAPAGSRIRLFNPASVKDRDRYGRKLRYADQGQQADDDLPHAGSAVLRRHDSGGVFCDSGRSRTSGVPRCQGVAVSSGSVAGTS
jgi:hypothetical protein